MARIRTVKPEFWTDDRVGECSVSARLLFIATWNFADDEGGLDRSAKQLKAQAFPYDQINCEPLIQELLKAGLMVEYEADGKKYLHIKGFGVHQKIEKKARARYPVYHDSMRTHGVVGEDSGSSAVSSLEGNGREGNGKDSPSSPPRGTDQVFAHWQSVHNHPKAVLDTPRRRVIERALKRYSPDTLCEAISGYCNSPHHMGQNKDGTVFDDISLLLRNSAHIEAGLRFARTPPTAQNETQRRQAANLQTATEWVAQGKDHADH